MWAGDVYLSEATTLNRTYEVLKVKLRGCRFATRPPLNRTYEVLKAPHTTSIPWKIQALNRTYEVLKERRPRGLDDDPEL